MFGIKKVFKKVNEENSTLTKQCISKNKCAMRFTTMCDSCQNNIGMKEEKNCYKPRR